MLSKRAAFAGLCAGVVLVALLLVFSKIQIDSPEQTTTDDLPQVLGGGLPPPSNMTDFIGSEIPRFVDVQSGVSGQSANSEHSKYDVLLVLDGYEHLYVYLDQRGDKDVILGKEPVPPDFTDRQALYSGKYIWITINPHDTPNVTSDYYASYNLNKGFRHVSINENIKNTPFKEMDQLVDWDGNDVVVRPSDLWFVTANVSYTIRGHISLEESVRLANIVLSIEE